MADLIFELLSEEIPARMQCNAATDFKALFEKALHEAGLTVSRLDTYVTPRRLALIVQGLPLTLASRREERRGPRTNAPQGAIEGFLRGVGVGREACIEREGYLYVEKDIPAQEMTSLLPSFLCQAIQALVWPKSMRWPGASLPWVRPVRHALCVFNGQPLSFDIPAFGLTTQGSTTGHRFLSPGSFDVRSVDDYLSQLPQYHVILDQNARQDRIRQGLKDLSKAQGLVWQEDTSLLEEVAGLVEYPVILLGRIDPQFMEVPAPVLITSMKVHQRYFTFTHVDGSLAPYFVAVANTLTTDQGKEMIHGFERVLRARLSDAKFFWEQDLKTSLEELTPRLETIIFHGKLGTVYQKVQRLQELVTDDAARRAALICKADLLTQMVGEFPELQGHMGTIYAQKQGHAEAVAQAIRAHYQPQGPNDACPSSQASVELALADKIDTLMGFFAIGEAPTGSRDPYALRRAALGVIRLARENEWREWDAFKALSQALTLYQNQGVVVTAKNPVQDAYDFILERLVVVLRGQDIRHDCVTAVTTPTQRKGHTLWSMAARAQALNNFLMTPDGQVLLTAYRRSARILEDDLSADLTIDPSSFTQDEEHVLLTHLQTLRPQVETSLKNHAYEQALSGLSTLRDPVDAFFEGVTVNVGDASLRQNRLALLSHLVETFHLIADFAQVEG